LRTGRPGQVAAALLLDAVLGEPPEALHPTVWMGRAISAVKRRARVFPRPRTLRLAGVALALGLPALSFVLCKVVVRLAPRGLRWLVEAALISTTVSMRGLDRAAAGVERELRNRDLESARARVGDFVGRDTAGLSPSEVARAAVESVAENTSDGVVAPMLYALLFGAQGALAYKAVNTLDSMVGYREPPYRDLGWASARLDDLANFAPSRATALMVAAVSGRPVATFEISRSYGPLTRSPNAGWAEAAFAGALDLRLGGANSYGGVLRESPILGEGRLPESGDVRRAVKLMRRCCAFLAVIALLSEIHRG
jgi:adenosylcobinamide-phosphate synthase